jgi:hypothetical protein
LECDQGDAEAGPNGVSRNVKDHTPVLDDLDPQGHARATLVETLGIDRGELLLGALAGAAAWTAGRASRAAAAGLTENDTRILRFDL